MAITIESEQMYKDGVAQTSPEVSGKYSFLKAGMDRSTSTYYRWVTVLTCKTTRPLTSLTLEIFNFSFDNTDSTKYFGMIVTTEKNDSYLTDYFGGETKLRFSCNCTDGGAWVANNTSWARGTVTKNIPSGTFYIYIVPYQNKHNYSQFYSKDYASYPAGLTGVEVEVGYMKIANGSSFVDYEVWIADGSKFVQYEPYVADGSKFVLCE